MKNSSKCAVVLFLLLFAVSATAKDQQELLKFSLGPEWNAVRSPDADKSTVLELVRKGDKVESWKELVTIQNFGKSRNYHDPSKTLDALKALREKTCPGVTEWTVLDKQEDSIVYEWHAKGCMGQPEQSEVARILYGKHTVFFLHYAARVHELTPETRAQWVKAFTAASIKTNTE